LEFAATEKQANPNVSLKYETSRHADATFESALGHELNSPRTLPG
jgi:hypothetical protein